MTSDREARAGLSGARPPGSRAWVDEVRALGAVHAWERALAEGRAERADGARHLLAAERVGARLLVPSDVAWPRAVDRLATALYTRLDSGEPLSAAQQLREPVALWVRGPLDLADVAMRSVAVVGSRAATRYGGEVASRLGADLAAAGWTVMSGGAIGIDAAAHRGAIAVGAPTVAVLASGVDVLYPRTNEPLLQRVLATGCVVSEVPVGFAPRRERFLTRNRVLAGLTRGVVLVEAGARSGALNTCHHAVAISRPVCAVPGSVLSARSVGCHDELRTGRAALVTSVADVVAELGFIGEVLPERVRAAPGPRDGLDRHVAHLLESVPAVAAASTEGIARAAGWEAVAASSALGQLAVAGLVERDAGRWRLTDLGRAPSAAPEPPPGAPSQTAAGSSRGAAEQTMPWGASA